MILSTCSFVLVMGQRCFSASSKWSNLTIFDVGQIHFTCFSNSLPIRCSHNELHFFSYSALVSFHYSVHLFEFSQRGYYQYVLLFRLWGQPFLSQCVHVPANHKETSNSKLFFAITSKQTNQTTSKRTPNSKFKIQNFAPW